VIPGANVMLIGANVVPDAKVIPSANVLPDARVISSANFKM